MTARSFARWRGRIIAVLAIAGVATVLTASAAPADEPGNGPATTITSKPASPTNADTATFAFTSAAAGTRATFRCALDDAAFATCTSPITYRSLGTGQHTFRVAARRDGAFGPTTTFRWEVDRRAPTIAFTAPANGATYTRSTWPALCGARGGLCGTASDPNRVASVTVAVLDGTGRSWNGNAFVTGDRNWLAANGTTAWSYALALQPDGTYTALARAKDALGNETPEASAARVTFTIDTTPPPPPTFVTTPEDPATATTARFTIATTRGPGDDDDDNASHLRCTLDGVPRTCGRTLTLTGLSVGNHCLAATTADRWGNVSAPTTYCWDVIVDKGFSVEGVVKGDLAPGLTNPVEVTITNPFPFALQVLELTTTIDDQTTFSAPPGATNGGCSGSTNFTAVQAGAKHDGKLPTSGLDRFVVPKGKSVTFLASDVETLLPAVHMEDLTTNQDACKGTTIHLHFTGIARKAPTP